MEIPVDIWRLILPHLATRQVFQGLWATFNKDLQSKVYQAITTFVFRLPNPLVGANKTPAPWDMIQKLTGLQQLTIKFAQRSLPLIGPASFSPGPQVPSSFSSPVLQVLDMDSSISITVTVLKNLPSLTTLAAALSKEVIETKMVPPHLKQLTLRSFHGKNTEYISALPTGLTSIHIYYHLVEKPDANTFAKLTSLTDLTLFGEHFEDFEDFPPNLQHLQLTNANFNAVRCDKLPLSLTNLSVAQARSAEIQVDHFAILPAGLKLNSLCISNFALKQGPASAIKTTLPCSLTRFEIGQFYITYLEALPSSLIHLKVNIQKVPPLPGAMLLHGPNLSKLFPKLQTLHIDNGSDEMEEDFPQKLPFNTLTDIDLGRQEFKRTHFWDNLSPQLNALKTNSRTGSGFTIERFAKLPKSLTYLHLCLGFDVTDDAVATLPPGLTYLYLLGTDLLTDSCIPNLPRGLKVLSFLDNYNLTNAMIPHLPLDLEEIHIGDGGSTHSKIATALKSAHKVEILFRCM